MSLRLPKALMGGMAFPLYQELLRLEIRRKKIDLVNVDLQMNEKKIKTRARIINLKLEGFDKGIWRTFKTMRIQCINSLSLVCNHKTRQV